jgi:hypothetical protein
MRELTFRSYVEGEPSTDAQVCIKLGQILLSEDVEAGDRADRRNYAELLEAFRPLLVFDKTNIAPAGTPEKWVETIRMRYEGGSIKVTEAAFSLLLKAWDKISPKFPARESTLLVKVDAFLEDVPVVKKDEDTK